MAVRLEERGASCAYFGRSCRPGIFGARVFFPTSLPRYHRTCEIRVHPRCRNGRTTFTRRNWPSKRNATTVSRYFSGRDGTPRHGRSSGDLQSRYPFSLPVVDSLLDVDLARPPGYDDPRRGPRPGVRRPRRDELTFNAPTCRRCNCQNRVRRSRRIRNADRYGVTGGVSLWRRRTRYRLVSFATVDPARPARPYVRPSVRPSVYPSVRPSSRSLVRSLARPIVRSPARSSDPPLAGSLAGVGDRKSRKSRYSERARKRRSAYDGRALLGVLSASSILVPPRLGR